MGQFDVFVKLNSKTKIPENWVFKTKFTGQELKSEIYLTYRLF